MVKKLTDSPCFLAGDHTMLRELLHPANDTIKTSFSLAHAYLEAGEESLPHKLLTSTETYFFLKGQGRISINNEVFHVEKNATAHVPANAIQSVKNTGTERLVFICMVSPPWSATDEEILL